MKNLLSLVLLCVSTTLFAQRFTIEGTIKSQEKVALEGATVFVQSIKDSVVIAYGITNKSGKFSFRVIVEGDDNKISFNASFLGYKPYQKIIDIPTGNSLKLGDVIVEDIVEELEEVAIIAKAPPIRIKKDTIEYNAGSFKTLPNDKAEDLLKKLPGVQIDNDGNITVNGIQVQAINVNGKRFFGEASGDIALKNLPSDIISKIQVTDYKTDLQKFTGEESDSGTKEINLKIKKGRNNSTFGDFNGGYGTDKKYQANANLFKLIEGKQLGVIGGANNINMSRGFNALPNANTSTGHIQSDFLGANFSKGKWDETQVNSNYRYSSQTSKGAQTQFRENFLPDLNYLTSGESGSTSDSDSHNANLDLRFIIPSKKKGSQNRTQIANEIKFDNSNSDSYSFNNTTSEYSDGTLVNDYNSISRSESSNYSLDNSFRVASRLGETRDFFGVRINTNFDKSDSDSEKQSTNILYLDNTEVIQNQVSHADNSGGNINVNLFLRKQFLENFRILPNYSASISYNNNKMDVFDFNETADGYTDFNIDLSSDSKYVTTTVKPSLKLRYQLNDIRFEVEGAYTNTYRKYDDKLIVDRNFKTDFQYLTYSGRVRYRNESGNKSFDLRYRQNVNLPSMNQLQPIADVSDITHIKTGNPLLEPAVNHSISMDYRNNLSLHNINVSGNARASFINDKITNTTITDNDLIKTTTYTNINGDYSLSGSGAISKSFFSKKTNINIDLRINGSYNNTISLQNDVKFTLKRTAITPSIKFKYAYDKKVDFSVSYSYMNNKNTYDTDIFNNNAFFTQNLRFDNSVYIFKSAFFTNKIAYSYNSRVGDEFDGDSVFWNAGIGTGLWDNKGTLTLVGYDILGLNNGFRRSVTETYIQDVNNIILEQYFMLTFQYKFGRFPTNEQRARGRGRGFRGGAPPRPGGAPGGGGRGGRSF